MAPPLYTIGHSTRTVEELVAILASAGVARVVDVRTIPRSRTNPQFNRDVLPATLAAAGLGYEHVAALGGRRSRRSDVDEAVNAGWTHRSFHAYADHALTQEFGAALADLLASARRTPTAVMCAEAVWWRCHRRIIADHALARGVPVVHLLSATKHEPARLTPFAAVGDDGRVTYPGSST